MTQPEITDDAARRDDRSRPEKKPRRRWIVHAIVWPVLAILLIGGGFAAFSLYNDAMSVRADLEDAQASVAALDELYGLGYNHHEKFAERVNGVSLDDIRKLAAARLHECVITVSTPEPEKVKIKEGPRTYPTFPIVDLTPRGVQHDTGGGTK